VQENNKLSQDTPAFRPERFINPSGFNKAVVSDLLDYPIIANSLKSGDSNNVFLLGSKDFSAFRINNLELSTYPYFSCAKVNNAVVKIKYISKGDMVDINAGPYLRYCMNAKNSNLCSGLNIAFSSGYCSECCTVHSVCCNLC
jgi:hypothetical protein